MRYWRLEDLGRSGYEPVGRAFESLRAHHFNPFKSKQMQTLRLEHLVLSLAKMPSVPKGVGFDTTNIGFRLWLCPTERPGSFHNGL